MAVMCIDIRLGKIEAVDTINSAMRASADGELLKVERVFNLIMIESFNSAIAARV